MQKDGKLTHWSSSIPMLKPVAADVNRIVDAINSIDPITTGPGLEVQQNHGGGVHINLRPDPKNSMVVVKITAIGIAGGKYNASVVYSNAQSTAGGPLAMPEGMLVSPNTDVLFLNLWENGLGDIHLLPVGTFALGRIVGYTNETVPRMTVVSCAAPQTGLFAVTVTQTGGYNGTSGSPASWTYTVKTADGTVTLGVNIQLTKPRPNGSMVPGNAFGLAFYQANGNLQLWDAGEIPD